MIIDLFSHIIHRDGIRLFVGQVDNIRLIFPDCLPAGPALHTWLCHSSCQNLFLSCIQFFLYCLTLQCHRKCICQQHFPTAGRPIDDISMRYFLKGNRCL